MRVVRRLAWSAIQALKLERGAIVLRACWRVKEPFRMLLGEAVGWRSGRPRRFTLRRSGSPVYLRVRSSDLRVFHEIFCYRGYDLPPRARRVLAHTPVALDAGANIGLFTLFLCEAFPGVNVTAFEPDPENAAIARRTLGPYIAAGQVGLIEAAVGTFDGRVPFLTGLEMTSRRAPMSGPGETFVRQVDLFAHLPGVGLLKLDVEGAEWDILRDHRWSDLMPPCLVMEWHGSIDDRQVSGPTEELAELLALADEVDHEVSDPGMVGQVWAFRPINPKAG